MDLQNFLLEALKERFKANSTVNAIQKKIEKIAEQKTFEKYKGKPLFRDEMEFELIGVKASFWIYEETLNLRDVDISLAYICKSKLPKAKRDKLEQVKANYHINKRLEWNNYKVAIWHELNYSIELKSVLEGNINLRIE
jgi:outer membrane receptor for ferrienterochelin and colicin